MTTSLTIRSVAAAFVAALALMLMWSSVAYAQSEVTGTLTSGTAAPTTSTSTISGTVVSGAQCQDTIDNDGDGDIDFPADDDCESVTDDQEEQQSGGGGGGSRRNSSNNNDNDDDDGEVLGTDTSSNVGGSGDVLVPGVPNTGAGQDALATLATLLGSLAVFGAGALALRRYSL